jgi:hypothetical protein
VRDSYVCVADSLSLRIEKFSGSGAHAPNLTTESVCVDMAVDASGGGYEFPLPAL